MEQKEIYYTFKTSDDIEYVLPSEIMNMFKYLASHINGPIRSSEFQLIVKYCEHHKYVNPAAMLRPLRSNDLRECVNDEWDANFISSLNLDNVTDILVAADMLKCESLEDLCYARLALYFRGKLIDLIIKATPNEKLKNDFLLTDEEFNINTVNEIKKENEWLMMLTKDRHKDLENI